MNIKLSIHRAAILKLSAIFFLFVGPVAFAQAPLTSLAARRFTLIDNNRYQYEIGTLSAAGFVATSTSNVSYDGGSFGTTPSITQVRLVNNVAVINTIDWDATEGVSANALSNYRRSGANYSLPLFGASGDRYYIVEWIGKKQVVADSLLIRRFEIATPTSFRCRILRLSASGASELSSMESPYDSGSFGTTPSIGQIQLVDQQNVLSAGEVTGLTAKYGSNYLRNYRFSATTYSLPVNGYAGSSSYYTIQWVGGFPDTGIAASDAKPINISTRLVVNQGGQGIMGFVVTGSAPTTVLIRAVGPTLAAFGVAGTMVDPRLTVFQGSVTVGTNDDWGSDASSALVAGQLAAERGAFALNTGTRDASKAFTLQPGAYTVSVQGANGGGGDVLMEVYF